MSSLWWRCWVEGAGLCGDSGQEKAFLSFVFSFWMRVNLWQVRTAMVMVW